MDDAFQARLAALPTAPGVYTMKDAEGRPLYVGKATSLRSRVRSYFQSGGPKGRGPWIHRMVPLVADVDVVVTHTALEALMLELNLIKQYRPPYNSRLTDDKHYPYLTITFEEGFPRLRVVRRTKQDGNAYFGPYGSSRAMWRTVRTLRQVFGVCSCNREIREGDTGPVCLDYHLGRCPGPCAGLIGKDDYRANMRRVAAFLSGQHGEVVRGLRKQMEQAAAELRFELAAKLRDQIAAIERVCEKQVSITSDLVDRDAIGMDVDDDRATVQVLYVRYGRLVEEQSFTMSATDERSSDELLSEFLQQYYARAALVPKEILVPEEPDEADLVREWLTHLRGNTVHLLVPQRGEKLRLVELAVRNAHLTREHASRMIELEQARAESKLAALQEELDLDRYPGRIECYDISTLQGSESVGSMVVLTDGEPDRDEYRRFRIRHETGKPDDFAMMREVLTRRFGAHSAEGERFAELPDLVVVDGGKGQLACALGALRDASLDIPAIGLAKRFEHVFVPGESQPRVLPHASDGLTVLTRLRDEAHRFAVTYHRKLREKTVSRSVLDDIPGIGPKRKRALLTRFASIEEMRRAPLDHLAAVPGMNSKAAAVVHKALNPTKTLPRRARRESGS